MSFNNKYQQYVNLIDDNLNKYLKTTYPEELFKAMQYSIFSGGKRIRPVLMLAVFDMLKNDSNSDSNAVLPFACALEMIHSYSLIHDDLPAMDDDNMRRGKPTNHVVFGEATAILAGDALLNKAFEVMAEHCEINPNQHNIKAMSYLAKCAGTSGMIGGQFLDIKLENSVASSNELNYIYTNKTSKLFMAAFKCAAILIKSSDTVVNDLEEIATMLGITFQIKDDLLDIYGTNEFGKPIGSDIKNNKNTFVSVFGEKQAQTEYLRLSELVLSRLKKYEKSEFMINTVTSLISRER